MMIVSRFLQVSENKIKTLKQRELWDLKHKCVLYLAFEAEISLQQSFCSQ